jgi:hypothetical protein
LDARPQSNEVLGLPHFGQAGYQSLNDFIRMIVLVNYYYPTAGSNVQTGPLTKSKVASSS